MRRRVLFAALLTGAMYVLLLACGGGEIAEAFREGYDEGFRESFIQECQTECSQSADASACRGYCGCAYTWANDNDRMGELTALGLGSSGNSPVERDLMAACGSDLFDTQFMQSCSAECGDDALCVARCTCMLRELRGPGDRGESTMFMMDNLSSEPPTPAGQARIDAATAICDPQ